MADSPPTEPALTEAPAAAPAHMRSLRGSKSKTLKLFALGLMLVPFALSIYAYNVERNIRGARRVRETCSRLLTLIPALASNPAAGLLFAEDAPAVRRDLHDTFASNCAALDERLVWWRLNVGAKMSMPPAPARAARLDRALRAAARRCPRTIGAAMRPFFDQLSVPAERRRSAIDEFCALVRSAPRVVGAPRTERLVWDWSDDYQRLGAALDRLDNGQLLGTPQPTHPPTRVFEPPPDTP